MSLQRKPLMRAQAAGIVIALLLASAHAQAPAADAAKPAAAPAAAADAKPAAAPVADAKPAASAKPADKTAAPPLPAALADNATAGGENGTFALPKASNVTATNRRAPVPRNVTVSDADKPSTMLSSALKPGSGASCVPTSNDFFGPGSGCADTEACCPTTNTCFDRSAGCAAFAARCPPPDCSDIKFAPAECPADVTKLFKSRGGVLCEASSDMACFANATTLALKCGAGARSGAAAERAAPGALALLLAALAGAAALVA